MVERTHLGQATYSRDFEQSLADSTGDSLLFNVWLGHAVGDADFGVAGAHCVGVDGLNVLWTVENAEGRRSHQVPHITGQVRLVAEGVEAFWRKNWRWLVRRHGSLRLIGLEVRFAFLFFFVPNCAWSYHSRKT